MSKIALEYFLPFTILVLFFKSLMGKLQTVSYFLERGKFKFVARM